MKKLALLILLITSLESLAQEPIFVHDSYLGTDSHSTGAFIQITAANNMLFFVSDDGSGQNLYKTDGTESGTVIVNGPYTDDPRDLISFNNQLYFFGPSLMKSDGTDSGTVIVKPVDFGSANSSPTARQIIGNTMYFSGYTAPETYLWKTDGSTNGTVRITTKCDYPISFVEMGGLLYFIAYDSVHGYELWKSDGTDTGTVLIKDITPGNENTLVIAVREMTVVGNTLFFVSNDGTGEALWKTDGTEAGTVIVKGSIGNTRAELGYLRVFNNTLFFRGTSQPEGVELWTSDGTEAGTVLFKNINEDSPSWKPNSNPNQFTVAGNSLFFFADDNVHGIELWKSDGTPQGTTIVKDNYAGGFYGASNYYCVAVGSVVYYLGNNGTTGWELWKSDGTEPGTVLVKDFNSGTGFESSIALTSQIVNNHLYLLADDGNTGAFPGLWRMDISSLLLDVKDFSKDLVKVEAYPNPTSGVLSLKIKNQAIHSLKLFSVFGKEVKAIVASNDDSIENINIQNLSTGIYLMQVTTDTNTFTSKIIKK